MQNLKTTTVTAYLLLLSYAVLAGCAPKDWRVEDDGAYDPLEPINRGTYKINKGLDWLLLKPTAKAYLYVPRPIRKSVDNVLNNLSEPVDAANNILQQKADSAVLSTSRFVINSVIGVGGIFDIASVWEVKRQDADFGQTLRGYGLNDTAYLVLPLVGPSTVADGTGKIVDSFLSPVRYINEDSIEIIVNGVRVVHYRSGLLADTDLAESVALDEYLLIRDLYEESRLSTIPTSGRWGK